MPALGTDLDNSAPVGSGQLPIGREPPLTVLTEDGDELITEDGDELTFT